MISASHSLTVFQALLLAANSVFADTNGISSRDILEEMEHIMVDNFGTNSDGFVNAITPCSKYVSGSSTTGEQTTAQWVWFSFHDMVTHNATAGTGYVRRLVLKDSSCWKSICSGVDASLGFESERPENLGG